MTPSKIKWHVQRDNYSQLHKFCQKHSVRSHTELLTRSDDEHNYFKMTFVFSNGGYITVELMHGDEMRGYSVEDRFEVLEYGVGTE